ncbi:hypothetical protein Tco_0489781 [Tanacetum coccineum]
MEQKKADERMLKLADDQKLNKIKEDFGKCFVTQKELSAEQAFWLKHSNYNLDTSVKSHTPVRIEAPSELPKVSLVNESFKKLKYHLAGFDKVVKKRTTSDAITAGAWGFEHTKACFVTEIITFLKVLKDTFNAFDKTLLDEIIEVQTIFNQMEAAIDQFSIDKNDLEIKIKQLSIDNDQLLNQIMSQEIVHIAVNYVDILDMSKSCVNECNKCLELETELLKKKDFIENDVYDKLVKTLKNELRKLKGKNVIDNAVSKAIATIASGMFKLDIEPISHRLKNNRDTQEDYLKKTIEYTDTIRGLIERARKQNPSEPLLDSACRARGSKPSGNTKKNRIPRPPSSKPKNKVEEHPRKVKSSLNKMNSVSEPISNSHRNTKFESICAICNKCLFDANHDMCLIDYVNDVNVHSKSKSKRNKIRKVWKPTVKVFTKIGYSWKPTGRIFTIVGNRCLLTRIASTKEVPLKETTITPVITPSSELKVYSRKPKASRSLGSNSKVKIVESKTSNTKKPKKSWGSTISDVPFSSLIDYSEDLGKLKPKADIGIFVGYAPAKKSFRIYNKRTRLIIETIHVDFDDLAAMASEQFSSRPEPKLLTPGTISSGLV